MDRNSSLSDLSAQVLNTLVWLIVDVSIGCCPLCLPVFNLPRTMCFFMSTLHQNCDLMTVLLTCSWRQRALIVIGRLLSWIMLVLSTSLSTAIFFLQFVQWWYASDQRASAMTSLPNPGPPSV